MVGRSLVFKEFRIEHGVRTWIGILVDCLMLVLEMAHDWDSWCAMATRVGA